MKLFSRLATLVLLAAAMTGCATKAANPKDPLEGFNRAMFKFNDTVDQVALKPAATVYQSALPSFVQTGVGNFFGNIGDVWTAANNLMQGKVADGVSDVMRVALNSTFGLGGLLDIGSEAGMTKHKEDFGQTLGVWGVKPGPYVVLPLFGSFTMRDALVFPVDYKADLWGYTTPVDLRYAGSVLRLVDKRAAVLDATNLLDQAALDKYEFVRDGFMQRRAGQIEDGNGPKSKGVKPLVDHDTGEPTEQAAAPGQPIPATPAK
ncbi:MAG: VacJ family lipoprotein [Pseudomonadota bacterium]